VIIGFTARGQSDWIEEISVHDSGSVIIHVEPTGSRLQIISGHEQEKQLKRRLDASPLRGKRVLVRVQVDFHPREESATAVLRLSLDRLGGHLDAWNMSTSQRLRVAGAETLQAALDVPGDATSLSLEVDVTGSAEARFDSPQLDTAPVPDSNVLALSDEAMSGLDSLAQIVGYLRFFHPSDEVVRIAWPDFEVEAIHRVLTARGKDDVQQVLRWIVARVAPTAQLYAGSTSIAFAPPPQGNGTRLTRWVRIGSGDDGDPYSAFRTGISEPSDVGLLLLKTVPSQGCAHATVRLTAKPAEGSPVPVLYIIPRRGPGTPSVASQVLGPAGSGSLDGDIPSGTTEITYGVRIGGFGVIDLTSVELVCKQKVLGSFAAGNAAELWGTASHLYSVSPLSECAGCLRVVRRLEETYEPTRDEIDVPVGQGLRLHMPLALWSDGKRSFPQPASTSLHPMTPVPPGDLAGRLASVMDIWITLRWFYPYFDDLHIDWDRALPTAFMAAAHARSADELLLGLGQLVAGLHDDHAMVYRPDYDNGILPFIFRLVDSKLYIVKGIDGYESTILTGSLVDTLDGTAADTVIAQLSSEISAATIGWLNAYLPMTLGEGPAGAMVSIGVRKPNGELVNVRVPRVARRRYLALKREDRPTSGTEVGPGLYYVDLAQADDATWKTLLPKLTSSRAVICDVRGGASSAGFEILAHFIDHEIRSPYWDSPILSLHGKQYERSQLSIFPLSPRLTAKLVFIADGSAASASETILQYARAAGLGVIVGEQSGGTNGDVAMFDSLNGLRVRFTGLRAVNRDGTTIQGRGIAPDIVAHPTPEGVRAGRDELLEAAISRAQAP
jgi:hypothetical protein